jgi:hypothetical protein
MEKNTFQSISFFMAGFAIQGVLDIDLTVQLDRYRPKKIHLQENKIKIGESINNDVQFGDKSIQ